MHYTTLGTPHRDSAGAIDNAVMVLHGTGGTGKQFLQPQFADELYGPGQPLDIRHYFIILPDNIGHGGSSKLSDGLGMHFPKYDYDDMVEAQAAAGRGLGVTHLRLIIGTSMGCMQAFVWAKRIPISPRLMPIACEPVEIAGSTGCSSSRSTASRPTPRGRRDLRFSRWRLRPRSPAVRRRRGPFITRRISDRGLGECFARAGARDANSTPMKDDQLDCAEL
jgi:pimeloyl-ACP methyl ester carboxylesterase